jgi:hypothetical protein
MYVSNNEIQLVSAYFLWLMTTKEMEIENTSMRYLMRNKQLFIIDSLLVLYTVMHGFYVLL